MAPFLLALMIFGITAESNASPYYYGDFPGDDEDGYDLAVPMSELCRQVFSDNEAEYDLGFVNFMLEVICPSILDDEGEGSGDFGGMQRCGLELLTIEVIVQALSRDPANQRTLMGIVDSTCQTEEGQGYSGIESFCRFSREGITISGGCGGGGGGSGSGSGSGDGDGDGGYGFSIYWSLDDYYSHLWE